MMLNEINWTKVIKRLEQEFVKHSEIADALIVIGDAPQAAVALGNASVLLSLSRALQDGITPDAAPENAAQPKEKP